MNATMKKWLCSVPAALLTLFLLNSGLILSDPVSGSFFRVA